jgi:hyperosmotically inducible periplasmic protein
MRFVWRDSAFPAVFAVVAAALVSACATAPPRSPTQERINAATADRIYAALQANPVFYFQDVDVSVDDGVAYLSGYVWTTDALYKAQRIARGVPGVTRVVDRMQLEREGLRGGGDGGGAQ